VECFPPFLPITVLGGYTPRLHRHPLLHASLDTVIDSTQLESDQGNEKGKAKSDVPVDREPFSRVGSNLRRPGETALF